jgi:3-methyladenine DNA glycosylase AlkC
MASLSDEQMTPELYRTRKGATTRERIPPEVLALLNTGELSCVNLVEQLAIDVNQLFFSVFPKLKGHLKPDFLSPEWGFTHKMAEAAKQLRQHAQHLGHQDALRLYAVLIQHPNDTVRGWAAYVLAQSPDMPIHARLQSITPLANDPHFGVREFAFIALKPHVAASLHDALTSLSPWVNSPLENIRRYAIEVTRPRGVWCVQLPELKRNPELARPLLEAVRNDPSRYVQNAVGNWLNDAGKSQPDWVKALCKEWQNGPFETPADEKATDYILKRGMRNLQ